MQRHTARQPTLNGTTIEISPELVNRFRNAPAEWTGAASSMDSKTKFAVEKFVAALQSVLGI